MTKDQIKAMQAKIGTVPDGFWGPKSKVACMSHLRSLMPKPNPWPRAAYARNFFGDPSDESHLTNLFVRNLGVEYEGEPVSSIRCHEKIAFELLRVIESIHETHPHILAKYDGCFNYRQMRDGTATSMHAYAAIDFDSENNGNKTPWPTKATMPLEVMEAFAREGAFAAGAFWGRDAMHFEFINQ